MNSMEPESIRNVGTAIKSKRKRLSSSKRKKRKHTSRILCKRFSSRVSRIYSSVLDYDFIATAIESSSRMCSHLEENGCDLSVIDDIKKDIKVMEGRVGALGSKFRHGNSFSLHRRAPRKRKRSQHNTQKHITKLIRRRRTSRNTHINSTRSRSSALPEKKIRCDNSSSIFEDSDSDSSICSDSSLQQCLSSSSDEVDSEIDDETYVPEVLSRKRGRKIKKIHTRRGNNESTLVEKEDIFADEYELETERYQFAFDLKYKDPDAGKYLMLHNISHKFSYYKVLTWILKDFKDQWLVGMEFMNPTIARMSWTEMKSLKKSVIHANFRNAKILLCRRNVTGQVYAANGFRDMIHFTIGMEGKKQLCTFLRNNEITYHELRGFQSDTSSPNWFDVRSMPNKSSEVPDKFVSTMQKKVQQLGKLFIPHLMKVCNSAPSNFNMIIQYFFKI